METIVERPAALDVHKASVTACVRLPAGGGQREEHTQQFSATVDGLLVLRDWLKAHGVTQVAMEATGERVPGRKTEVLDAQWLCQLLEGGAAQGEPGAAKADPRAAQT